MATTRITGQEYKLWLEEIKEAIRNSRVKAALRVNAEMLYLYWYLGKAITIKQAQANWGDGIITQLSADLASEFTELQGFSATNLKYIRRWYQFYNDIGQQAVDFLPAELRPAEIAIGQQAVDQLEGHTDFPAILGIIPWGHHIQIFTKTNDTTEALFYIQEAATNNWSRAVLTYHLESGLFTRKGKSYNNFPLTLPKPQSDLAIELIKNPYNLAFLNLSKEANERDLENAILSNIKKFLLELGSGFSFLGQQYHLKAGERDYYVDLLFYHIRLRAYFAIELKVTEFKPEHAGQLEFYLTTIDEQIKTEQDNPTIGLLLVKSLDKITVEYTLKSKTKSMGVVEYKHSLSADMKKELPDIDAIKQELQKDIVLPKRPFDEKIKRLKELVGKMNSNEADIEKTDSIILKIFNEVERPLIDMIMERLKDIRPMFNTMKINFSYNGKSRNTGMTSVDMEALIKSEGDIWMLGFEFSFEALKKAGTKAFSSWHKIEIQLEKYKYTIGPDRVKIWEEKVYRNVHTLPELEKIADRFAEEIIDDIVQKSESIIKEK